MMNNLSITTTTTTTTTTTPATTKTTPPPPHMLPKPPAAWLSPSPAESSKYTMWTYNEEGDEEEEFGFKKAYITFND